MLFVGAANNTLLMTANTQNPCNHLSRLLVLLLLPCRYPFSLQIVTQLNSFLLAAFESTAAAICFTVYFIAQHPAVEARLVQEVSAQQHSAQLDLEQVCTDRRVV
jgi:cytochrome P450